jgi:cell wall-associated NlpC family hydrolase
MKKKAVLLRLSSAMLLLMLVIISIIVPPLTRGEKAVLAALEKLGCKYVFREDGPNKFDCSGLTKFCYSQFGIDLVHNAETVGYDDGYTTLHFPFQFAVGDLIFFDTVSSDKDACDHVGLWMGGNRFIHASSSQKKVIISQFDDYYAEKFSWGKRIVCPFF